VREVKRSSALPPKRIANKEGGRLSLTIRLPIDSAKAHHGGHGEDTEYTEIT
jgi:hypothetical protein